MNLKLIVLSSLFLAFCLTSCQPQADEKTAETDTKEAVAHEEEEEEMPGAEFPADSVAENGMGFYGMRIDPSAAYTNASEIPAILASNGGEQKMMVTGEVDAVCQMKGCWVTMKLPGDEEMRVKFQDYGFFLPKDCAGKVAMLDGVAYLDTTSVEDLRHYAVDGGATEEEAAAKYTEPEIAISFLASGVALAPAAE